MENSPNSKNSSGITRIRSIPPHEFKQNENSDRNIGNSCIDFKIISEIGRGSYGVVNKVVSNIDNRVYVMKKINIKHVKQKHQKEAIKEAQILKRIRHPNVIKYYTSFIEDEHLYILMEYAEGGDLQQLLKLYRERKQVFTEKQVWIFAWELCQAVEYLHSNNIIHRDIKTLNILLTKDHRIKLGDLGVSKIVSSAASLHGTRVGTPLYLSPELVKQQPYDYKVDIWAVGCVLYNLCALEPPFYGENLITLGYNIVHKAPKALPNAFSPRLSSIILKFLEKNPSNRPRIAEMLEGFPSKLRSSKNSSASNDHVDRIEIASDKSATILRNEFDQQKQLKDSELNLNKQSRCPQLSVAIPDEGKVSADKGSRGETPRSATKEADKKLMSERSKLKVLGKSTMPSVDEYSLGEAQNRDEKLETPGKSSELVSTNRQLRQNMQSKKLTSNEQDTTIETRMKVVTSRIDQQGNESTLSVRKCDNNINSKEDLHPAKQNSRISNDNKVIPEERIENKHKKSRSGLKDDNKDKEKGQLAINIKDLNVEVKNNRPGTSPDFKRIMMNPLIKFASPVGTLANNKFAQIISLRNEKNFNIMKNPVLPHNSNNENLVADYRIRPVSAQVGSRIRKSGSGGIGNFRVASPNAFDDGDQEDVYEDKDEGNEGNDAFDNFVGINKGRSVLDRPKSAVVTSRPTFLKKESVQNLNVNKGDINNQQPSESKGQNLKLKDLLAFQSVSPKNRFPLEDPKKTSSKIESKVGDSNVTQEKTGPFINDLSRRDSLKTKFPNEYYNPRPKDYKITTEPDANLSKKIKDPSEIKDDPFLLASQRQTLVSQIRGNSNDAASKPFAQSAAGFYRPQTGGSVNTTTRDQFKDVTKDSSIVVIRSAATPQTRVNQDADNSKTRPTTSAGVRRKFTIKDLQE